MGDTYGIPRPSLRRLPIYYRHLIKMAERQVPYVSSRELGLNAGVPASQVRKDLSYLHEYGRPGVGYDTKALAGYLEDFLGLANDKEAILVGVGNLGRALALYPGFAQYGLQIIALFDIDPAKVGQLVGDREVLPMFRLVDLAQRLKVQMGIIAVPPDAAQEVASAMVAGGIRVIWNFAPCKLTVPAEVLVKNEDLAAELAALSHHIMRRSKVPAQRAK